MGVQDWLKGVLGTATTKAAESELAAKVVDKAAEKALQEAKEAAAKAGDALLDDLETALLGKKGAADELNKAEADVDPLARARKAYGLDSADKTDSRPQGGLPTPNPPDPLSPGWGKGAPAPAAPAPSPRVETAKDREDRARAELAELKKRMGKKP